MTTRRKRYTVTITHRTDDSQDRKACVLAVDAREARDRGIAKMYGKRASWWADSGVRGRGQVIVPTGTTGYRTVTPRVALDIGEGW